MVTSKRCRFLSQVFSFLTLRMLLRNVMSQLFIVKLLLLFLLLFLLLLLLLDLASQRSNSAPCGNKSAMRQQCCLVSSNILTNGNQFCRNTCPFINLRHGVMILKQHCTFVSCNNGRTIDTYCTQRLYIIKISKIKT